MSHRRLRPLVRGLALVPVLAAAAIAACADSPLAPAARPGAAAASLAADAFGLTPVFAKIDPSVDFVAPFTHTPDITIPIAPIRWDTTTMSSDWSIVRHQRDPDSWYRIEEMDAWHGSMCQKPDDAAEPTHKVSEYRDMVFLCRNHIMTANNSSGYGATYLTPNRMLDFSAASGVVRFDVATLRESGRDWIDIWLTPYGDNLVVPLDDSLPDGQGEPRHAVHVRMTPERRRSAFFASVIRNHKGERLDVATDEGYETVFARTPADTTGTKFLAPSATRRDTFELHISRTHLKFGMPRYNLWWIDTEIPKGLGWSRAVVQIGHHSFDPTADGGKPTTWHWDNVGVAPAVPFTIQRASRRYVDDTTSNELTFATPAPAGAHLRGEAVGSTEVSFAGPDGDFGKWADLRPQSQKHLDRSRFVSGWMPIPEGTTRVRFRSVKAKRFESGGRWMVRDVEIWAAP